jgi:nitrite reductase/ring-hydroxylating ferredoxin subunit/uncharacterized membrane protein
MSMISGVLDRVAKARGLDGVAEPLAGVVRGVLPAGPVADTLHGVWLGHPVHPVAVQVTLGAWASAAVLDLAGGDRDAARRLVGVGLLAAPGAIAAGWADWVELEPEQRRVGLVHAAANAVATTCFAVSYLARRRGRHRGGVLAGLAGLAAGGLGGVLGGHLAYAQGAGANHAESELRMAGTGWHDLGPLADYPVGTPVGRSAGAAPVVVCRHEGGVAVLASVCSHVGGPLHEGTIEDGCLVCPWHESRFALADGSVRRGPATAGQPTLETRLVDGNLQVRADAAGSHWEG